MATKVKIGIVLTTFVVALIACSKEEPLKKDLEMIETTIKNGELYHGIYADLRWRRFEICALFCKNKRKQMGTYYYQVLFRKYFIC